MGKDGASSTFRRPAGRYDAGRGLLTQRLLAVILVVVVVALVGALVKTLYERTTRGVVDARVLGFTVVSDSAVDIRFEVFKDAGERAYCIVRSRGLDGAEVGKDVVVVDGTGTADRRLQHEATLRTTAEAVTGELAGCSPRPIDKNPDHHG